MIPLDRAFFILYYLMSWECLCIEEISSLFGLISCVVYYIFGCMYIRIMWNYPVQLFFSQARNGLQLFSSVLLWYKEMFVSDVESTYSQPRSFVTNRSALICMIIDWSVCLSIGIIVSLCNKMWYWYCSSCVCIWICGLGLSTPVSEDLYQNMYHIL